MEGTVCDYTELKSEADICRLRKVHDKFRIEENCFSLGKTGVADSRGGREERGCRNRLH